MTKHGSSNALLRILQKIFACSYFTDDYDLLSNWASIGILLFMPVFIWLMHVRGVRFTVILGAFLVALGCGLRCLPLETDILK